MPPKSDGSDLGLWFPYPETSRFGPLIGDDNRSPDARRLRGRVSGLCQPTYVPDIPGGHGKVPIGPDYLDQDNAVIRDPDGDVHRLAGEIHTRQNE